MTTAGTHWTVVAPSIQTTAGRIGTSTATASSSPRGRTSGHSHHAGRTTRRTVAGIVRAARVETGAHAVGTWTATGRAASARTTTGSVGTHTAHRSATIPGTRRRRPTAASAGTGRHGSSLVRGAVSSTGTWRWRPALATARGRRRRSLCRSLRFRRLWLGSLSQVVVRSTSGRSGADRSGIFLFLLLFRLGGLVRGIFVAIGRLLLLLFLLGSSAVLPSRLFLLDAFGLCAFDSLSLVFAHSVHRHDS